MPVATGTPSNENGPDVLWQREGGFETRPYDVMAHAHFRTNDGGGGFRCYRGSAKTTSSSSRPSRACVISFARSLSLLQATLT